MTRSHAFSRALRQPHVITSSFDWFNVSSVSYVIGQSNYFGFGFTTLKRKPLYSLLYQVTYFSKNIDDYDVKENNDNDDDCFYVRTAVPYLTT